MKTFLWMVLCGVLGKVPFSSMLENLNKGCHPNIPPLPHVFLCLTLAKGTIQPIVIIFVNHCLLLTLFNFSGKFDGGDIDDDGHLDVDVQDTLGHFVVHCHQTRPLLVLGNTDGVGRLKLLSSAV